ncbi:MAG: GDP-L-fucose synthase [Flavobacteriaceae bacterium]|nr:GDP-L-fucose synthase [Flavobacteriaceae bacterium]
MEKDSKIFVAGHRGLVGSAILENLKSKGYTNLLTKTRQELDLIDQLAVKTFFKTERPEYVFLAAARVGGIVANNLYRGEFIYDNMMIQNNVIHHSYLNGVKKLLFLGSTCIYPKNAPQPMKEEYLLTDVLEYTNEPYAIAKIAGIKICESYNLQYGTNFLSVMPTNLYGPNDNFDFEKSHVLPALLRKTYLAKLLADSDFETVMKNTGHESKEEAMSFLESIGVTADRIQIWGTGAPLREFLWSEDMADACVFIMESVNFSETYDKDIKAIRNTHINIGTGQDISIADLAVLIKEIVGFEGELVFDTSKPDGTYRKLTDVSKLNSIGWKHKIDLVEGIKKLYDWYVQRA